MCLCGEQINANATVKKIMIRGATIFCNKCYPMTLVEQIISRIEKGELGIMFATWQDVRDFRRLFPIKRIEQFNWIYCICSVAHFIRIEEDEKAQYARPLSRYATGYGLLATNYVKFSELKKLMN